MAACKPSNLNFAENQVQPSSTGFISSDGSTPTPSGAASTAAIETRDLYRDEVLKIELLYPSDWSPLEVNPSYIEYGGTEGFFRVIARAGMGSTLEELAKAEVSEAQQQFGPGATIQDWQSSGQEGRRITPSEDQPGLDAGKPAWGEIVLPYPRPVLVAGELMDFFILQSDLEHLAQIAESVTFKDADLAEERYPAASETPAAGICDQPRGSSVQVPISLEIPSPRCVKAGPRQTLTLVNQIGEPITIRLAWYEITLGPHEERSLGVPVSSYLATGVHRLELIQGHGNPAEIWVIENEQGLSGGDVPVNFGTVSGPLVFSPDGSTLAAPASRGIGLYDPVTLTPMSLIEVDTGARFLAFSPDSTRLAGGAGWHVQLWQKEEPQELNGWSLVQSLTGSPSSPESMLVDLSFSPDGRALAAGFRDLGQPPDGAILMWSAIDGRFESSRLGMTFDYSPQDPRLVAVWQDTGQSTIYSYSFAGSPTDVFPGDEAYFSPTGLLAIRRDGAWRLLDMKNGDTVASFNGQSLTFSNDGALLAVHEGWDIRLFRHSATTPFTTLEGSWEQASQLQFSSTSQTLAATLSGCPTGETCEHPQPTDALWRISDGRLIMAESGPDYGHWLTYSLDGTQLLTISEDGTIAALEIIMEKE